MRKSVLVVLSLVTCITFLVSFMKPKESVYKNLKVLPKDISKEDMDSVMKHFATSLGVKCNFCHVSNQKEHKWDFASDSIGDKLICRKMMIMTYNINKKYFKEEEDNKKEEPKKISNLEMTQEVACYTCHRGAVQPLTIPPPMQQRIPGQMRDSTRKAKE